MKTPVEYLAATVPTPGPIPLLIPAADAERAIALALHDAAREKETYAHLLLRALRPKPASLT